MGFKIVWTESAIGDLKEICEYLASENRLAARKVGQGILDHVKILETFPYVGPSYPRRSSSGAIREIVYGSYRIFYEVSDKPESVHILRVWHGARQEPGL
jgi:plasmid stabilization system protein ParE